MGWDSNPRNPCEFASFQDWCLKPLGHPSSTTDASAFGGTAQPYWECLSRRPCDIGLRLAHWPTWATSEAGQIDSTAFGPASGPWPTVTAASNAIANAYPLLDPAAAASPASDSVGGRRHWDCCIGPCPPVIQHSNRRCMGVAAERDSSSTHAPQDPQTSNWRFPGPALPRH